MKALIDSDRKARRGKNQYTAQTFVTDSLKQCSWCDEIKPHSAFHKDKNNKHGRGLAYYCKDCALANTRAYHNKQIAENNIEYIRKKRSSRYKCMHGISLVEFEQRLKEQDYKCAICKITLDGFGQGTHMDHCHKSNKIRDILCTNCNRGLGHFQENEDNLMAAIKYLQAHKSDGSSKEGRSL